MALARSVLWEAARDSWGTHPPLAAALAALTVLSSLVLAGATLATGALVTALPDAVAGGPGSPAATRLALALGGVGLCFVLQHVDGPLRHLCVAEALGRRYMGRVHRRVMRAALRPATIRHLEDPSTHDLVRQALGEGNIGARVSGIAGVPPGLSNLAAQRVRGVIALLMVAHFSAWLALLLAAAWLFHERVRRRHFYALISFKWRRTPQLRYATYLGGLPLDAQVAKEVRVFGLGPWLGQKFESSWLAAMAGVWGERKGLGASVTLATLPVLAAQALALALAGRAAVSGEIGLGALVIYTGAILQTEAFGNVSDAALALQYGTASLKPLAELERRTAHDPALVLPGARLADDLPRHSIRFANVSFTYPRSERAVLDGPTLEIPAGQSLAVVGANGAGKTTFVKLLARLYDPTAGRITVDGIDLREIDPYAWQRRIAAIFQDFVKYQLSAHDNVAFGAPHQACSRDRVVDAARRAGALELIEALPRGWDTILSREYTGGADLSGGQWQRVALARALFAASAGAPVLIMDEPTAHLDVRAEAAFYDSFLDLTAGLTTVVISHRFSTVRRAQRIVVLDRGGVVEQGSHDDLMRLGGTYARMFTLQAQRFV